MAAIPPPETGNGGAVLRAHLRIRRANGTGHRGCTKQVVCKYKGSIYFPALGYLRREWENPVFLEIRKEYSTRMKEEDPESWAIWPLVYQDPYRRVKDNEWPDQPGNPSGISGEPSRYNWFGTDQQGYDVFAQMVHGTKTAMLVGFVSMGIASGHWDKHRRHGRLLWWLR